jgi:dTDP-4-dehydrorhamnose reductase
MKVVVFGANGLLGEALCRCGLELGHDVNGVVRAQVDLQDTDALTDYLKKSRGDVYLYAAGLTSLEVCLDDRASAVRLNVRAAAAIAKHANSRGAQYVYYSTDYVYGGEIEKELDESSPCFPVNAYGLSKLVGEKAVTEAYGKSLVMRVSWLFGRGRTSFVDSVLQSLIDGEERSYIGDKWSVPNWSDNLARLTYQLLDKNAKGVVNAVSNGGGVSWYEYAVELAEVARSLGLINEYSSLLKKAEMAEVKAFRETRPRYTVMSSKRLEAEFLVSMPNWREALRAYIFNQYVQGC